MSEPTSPNSHKDEQTVRFRAILDGNKDDGPEPAPALESSRSILDRLPHAAKPVSLPVEEKKSKSVAPPPVKTKRKSVVFPPVKKKRKPASPPLEMGTIPKSRKERVVSAYWTVTGTVSLAVDAILIAVIIILLLYVRKLNLKMNELTSLSSMPLEMVSGLYKNFESMDQAHINTTIPYDTEIPVQFDLNIDQQTVVVLSQDTPVNTARVTLNTGGLNITNAPANIILPAGTRLPIQLSLAVPVNKNVPVHLLVPVDIDLAATDLGKSFTGLMDVLEPLYCLLDPKAVDSQGVLICDKAKTP